MPRRRLNRDPEWRKIPFAICLPKRLYDLLEGFNKSEVICQLLEENYQRISDGQLESRNAYMKEKIHMFMEDAIVKYQSELAKKLSLVLSAYVAEFTKEQKNLLNNFQTEMKLYEKEINKNFKKVIKHTEKTLLTDFEKTTVLIDNKRKENNITD